MKSASINKKEEEAVVEEVLMEPTTVMGHVDRILRDNAKTISYNSSDWKHNEITFANELFFVEGFRSEVVDSFTFVFCICTLKYINSRL